ncbi:cytotoxic translational repressor of toxin-antitoxin stability system [Nostoc sp. CENA543]|uniref:type II toxin-antitoxin system RelE family toxin n=2 Tax=unclassified Nostoc TaxID=2593658 RepID=UPI000CA17036|nr:type II toxin-antitoxin system RelE/ParE family toxin [Nostoc sp. CENA543]AUT02429.1 cytotoxic translational repressor of toxin-antitoxin stability system [Nostoc sp. CENA543]
MARLDGLATVLDFLNGLQPKIAAQIAKKVLALNIDPLPADSKQLSGYPSYYRVDSGEYRIVYRFFPEEDLVEVILVGKRNDDEV